MILTLDHQRFSRYLMALPGTMMMEVTVQRNAARRKEAAISG